MARKRRGGNRLVRSGRWEREKLAPDPPDVVGYRFKVVRKRDGGRRLILLALRRGGGAVAVSKYRPKRARRRRR